MQTHSILTRTSPTNRPKSTATPLTDTNKSKSPPLPKPELTEGEIRRFYNAPQPVAALLLGVSLSSLKRRYYEICRKDGTEPAKRWPYQSLTIKQRKTFIYFILNGKEENSKTLDDATCEALDRAFKRANNTINYRNKS